MPFGMVSEASRRMGVLDGGSDRRRRRGSFGGEFGVSHCNQWGLCCIVVRERCALLKLLRHLEFVWGIFGPPMKGTTWWSLSMCTI